MLCIVNIISGVKALKFQECLLLLTTHFVSTLYILLNNQIMWDEWSNGKFFRHSLLIIVVFFLSFNISGCFEISLCEQWSITNENNSKEHNYDLELSIINFL